MAEPPSYEESTTLDERDSRPDEKVPQRCSIREEVGARRSQHVAALVYKLLPQVRERAKQGLSKSTLLLLPSNQDCSRKGQLVGFPQDELPVLIQLEGRQDTIEFWTQREALEELKSQMLAAVSESVPTPSSTRSTAEGPPLSSAPSKYSFFGKKQRAGVSEVKAAPSPARPATAVDVQLDEVHFRSENEFGLYQTLRGRGVLVIVNVGS